MEKMILDGNQQVEDMKKLAEESEDVEMIDLVADLNKKLVFSKEKLKKAYSQIKPGSRDNSSDRPKPIFKKETSFQVNDHWYSRQSPSVSNWAEDVEEEYPRGSFASRSPSRTRWSDQQEGGGGNQSYLRGAYRDPFLQVMDKLANRMDRPARPAPPAWPVFTDKYQDYPKWRKDVTSYLKDYCSSLKNETKVLHLKEKCFSKKTVALLDSFESLDEIFTRLEQIYRQPACYAVEAMRPFQNQKLKADTDCVGLELAYQKIVKILKETEKLDQSYSLAGPEYVWRMTSTLSQQEIGLWKGFKRQHANRYNSELHCFLDFSQDRLQFWADLADEARAMATHQGTAPAAKPAGGSDGHKSRRDDRRDDRRDGRDSRKPWNQSKGNYNDSGSKFQAQSNAAQSQGTPQQPQYPNDNYNNPPSTRFNREFRCGVPSCEDKVIHSRKNCGVFNNLPVGARWDLVKQKEWCPWCLGHWISKDCYSAQKLEKINRRPECGEGGCRQPHHPLLHHLQANLSSLRLEVVERPEAAGNTDNVYVKSRCYLVPQIDVVVIGGVAAVVQYDSGSQCSSISADFAKKQGIRGRMCDIIVNDGLSLSGTRVTEMHELPFKLGPNHVVNRYFLELPTIGSGGPVEDVPNDLKDVFFPGCEEGRWATWDGRAVDVVVGMDNADLFPMPLAWRDALILSKSLLSNHFIVWGREDRIYRPELGPLEVNELMPEAHIFNQSIEDHSIVIQEDPEEIVPSAPELESSAPEEVPSASEPEQVASQEEPEQIRSVCSSGKMLCGSLPFLSSLFLFPFLLYFFTSRGTVEAFTAYDCQNRSNRVTSYSLIEPESCHSHVTDLRFVRILNAEIIQVKKTRIVPVHRCLAVESEFSQYCGHSSAAGVLRILRFRENRGIDSADCRKAFSEKGKITVGGKEFSARLGEMSSHSQFLTGDLDDSSHCSVGTHAVGDKKLGNQAAQRVLEISLFTEQGEIDDAAGTIKLPDGLLAKYKDETVRDSRAGTFVWSAADNDCPSTLSQIFRGDMKFHVNSTDASNLLNGMAVLERADQVAGLELTESFHLCHHAAWRTHLRDIIIVIHGDNFSSVALSDFDPSAVSELTRLESEISFLHVKSALSQKEVLRQVKLAICENRRQLLISRMEAVAGTDSQYALNQVLGKGVLLSKAGSAVYVTHCSSVNVEPRVHSNCTLEIPAILNGSNVFVDPISFVVKLMGTVVRCNEIAPPRFFIEGAWYCNYATGLRECHAPLTFP